MCLGAAVVGMFTMAGLAGSYSRMLLKAERFNELRREHQTLQSDYAKLESREREKEVQAAALGALASEVSSLYGITTNKISSLPGVIAASPLHVGRRHGHSAGTEPVVAALAENSVPAGASNSFSDASYYKSLHDFYALRNSAMDGSAMRVLSGSLNGSMSQFTLSPQIASGISVPTLWPVTGPITSPFGSREDPILGTGEGEFHKGVDISAAYGTPIRATAAGVVKSATFGNGYGREVVIDHGSGIETVYGHMSGFHVTAGEQVVEGQIIGYVGSSGRSTGAHCHYEVRVRNIPVNPHKYLRATFQEAMLMAKN